MKRKHKHSTGRSRLTLARETIRTLSLAQLGRIPGGQRQPNIDPAIPPSLEGCGSHDKG
jgi:hypothetical protein